MGGQWSRPLGEIQNSPHLLNSELQVKVYCFPPNLTFSSPTVLNTPLERLHVTQPAACCPWWGPGFTELMLPHQPHSSPTGKAIALKASVLHCRLHSSLPFTFHLRGLKVIIFQASLSHPLTLGLSLRLLCPDGNLCTFPNQTPLTSHFNFQVPQSSLWHFSAFHISCSPAGFTWPLGTWPSPICFLLGSISICLQEIWFLQNELPVVNNNIFFRDQGRGTF